ncbi:MAG: LysM peptidoglycan-binding domain-containing protein [Flavobacteriales bacterium]
MIARLLFLLLLVLPFHGQAQEMRTIDGRKFIVHHVQAGQTLYAISRTYAVPVDVLIAANPGASDGLSIGEELLVPKDAVVKKEAKTAPSLSSEGVLRHTVAKKETLFGIARKYGVEVNDMLQRNPELNAGVHPGMIVIIPLDKVAGQGEVLMRPAAPENTVVHVVEPGETLFSLGQHYGVTPAAIQAANGGLPDGLKAGASVHIPVVPGGTVPRPIPADSLTRRQSYHVGLLLPFSIARNDSALGTTAGTSEGPRYYEATRIAAQFYGAALMALDSMRSLGLNADVTVLDLGDDARSWNAAIKRPEIAEMDLFIGPFHRTAIEQLSRLNSHAHIVCPVPQSNKVILGQPNVSKVTPTRSDLVKHAARYIGSRHARDNVILLRPDIASERELQDQMAIALQEAVSAQPGRLRDTVLVAKPGRRDLGDLAGKLNAAQLNVIVAPTEDVELVTTLVSKLKPLSEKYRIVLVGLESWLDLGSVASSDLDLLGFTFPAGTFTDPADPKVEAFVKAFRKRYHTDADEYAFLGFDVTFYYLKALLTQGTAFPDHFDQVRTEPLHMGFRMQRTGPENGFRNEQAIMLQQRDLQLQKAP